LNQLNLKAATADLEKAKNDIRMNVAEAYVQILYDMEIADVAHRQIEIDSAQVARLEAFVKNGKAAEAELSQQKATLANSRLTATQADNNTRLAILSLTQLLELPAPDGFTIVRPDIAEIPLLQEGVGKVTPDVIYAEALGIKPEILSQELKLKGTEHSIKIAKAANYPTLSLSGGLSTNYYTTSGFNSDSFSNQIKNNFSQYIGLNLNVPIFNRFQTRNNIRSARIDQENQQLQLENTKKTLYKEIQQVYYNALNAQTKEKSSEEAVQSTKDAFLLMQAKYENGKATITEFNESKNNYLKSESDLVQARYENLYQHALLEFYRGKELAF
jgi:outer membrane protein